MDPRPELTPRGYDIFLAHGSGDKELVRQLYDKLIGAGLSVFLDQESLDPGFPWRPALEEALRGSRSLAFCVGGSGPGPWTELELNHALAQNRSDSSYLVIPVLLPGGSRRRLEEHSELLKQFQYVDLSAGVDSQPQLKRLIELIRQAQAGSLRDSRSPLTLPVGEVQDRFTRLQERFSTSLRPHLAGGELIRRRETEEVHKQLRDPKVQVVVVHGAAGSGKSGVLLELTERLAAEDVTFLPLRLDRLSFEGDPRRFAGHHLQLPASVPRCLEALAGERGAILVVDQLDALRWTMAHSAEAWDVCREIMTEVLSTRGLKVVVSCRTFDLDHDPQLRSWEVKVESLRRVEVGQLSEDDVELVVQRAVGDQTETSILLPRELALLRHVQHLQMWLAIYESRKEVVKFDTTWSLLEQFWSNRRDELARAGIDPARAEEIERRLVAAMENGAVLSAPVRKLDLSEKELRAYQTLHLLQVNPKRSTPTFNFAHQSHQDYLIAKHLLRKLDRDSERTTREEIFSWLGHRESQSLFRREQLRLLLTALRAEAHRAYLPVLQNMLPEEFPSGVSPVRFHLRLLALQFLSQQEEPLPVEKKLVLDLIDQPYWREHILEEVVRGKVPWFNALDGAGRTKEWLAGHDEKLRDRALELLLSVVENSGDRVARLLRPYVGKDLAWTRRASWTLRFDPSKDSDTLFELRLELAKRGAFTGEHVDWGDLAQKHPERFLTLAPLLILALANRLIAGEKRRRPGMRGQLDWHTLVKVGPSVIPSRLWSLGWKCLFPAVVLLSKADRYRGEGERALESLAVEFETLEPVLRLLRDLGGALLEESWREFVRLGENLSRGDPIGEILFMDTIAHGPSNPALADWALSWLMADPWRARLRLRRDAGEWALSARFINQFASVCSSDTYHRLEDWLLHYVEPDFLERYRRRHERIENRGDLSLASSFGRTPHVLLPRLPSDRSSKRVLRCCAELRRKFGPPLVSDTSEGGQAQGGFVGSPLRKEATERMSDKAWLDLASSEKVRRGRGRGKLRWTEGGDYEEVSTETIASEFRQAAQREPERFGRLLARWPATGEPAFLRAILSGLAYPGDNRGGRDRETWNPPSHEMLEEVFSLPLVQALARGEQRDRGVASDLCSILRRYADYSWSATPLDFVVWVAQHHDDPAPGHCPLGSKGSESEVPDRLAENALNVTRGSAGYAIRALLFKKPPYFDVLRQGIESLIADPHPAVRVAGLAACLPVINIDREQAMTLFLAAELDPEAILATREVRDFLSYTYRTHWNQLLPTIEDMVLSQQPRVATAGAALIAAAYLVEGRVQEKFQQCITGTAAQRKGVAEVAASLLSHDEYAERAKSTLLRLAEDDDEEVAREVASSFEHLDLNCITADRAVWKRFARSMAFQADPTPLLLSLERQSGDLLPFADCLLAAGTTFAEELAEKARDHSRPFAGDARLYLLPLLLRLYDQAKDRNRDVYLCCLDLWDRLLERRVGQAMGLTSELDRM